MQVMLKADHAEWAGVRQTLPDSKIGPVTAGHAEGLSIGLRLGWLKDVIATSLFRCDNAPDLCGSASTKVTLSHANLLPALFAYHVAESQLFLVPSAKTDYEAEISQSQICLNFVCGFHSARSCHRAWAGVRWASTIMGSPPSNFQHCGDVKYGANVNNLGSQTFNGSIVTFGSGSGSFKMLRPYHLSIISWPYPGNRQTRIEKHPKIRQNGLHVRQGTCGYPLWRNLSMDLGYARV